MRVEEVSNEMFVAVEISHQEAFWQFCRICTLANANLNWTLADLNRLFLPPIVENNYRLFCVKDSMRSHDFDPVAFCTWAFLSDEAADEVYFRYADPKPTEWNSGPNLWIIDLVTVGLNASRIGRYLQRDVFKKVYKKGVAEHAWALRRDDRGRVLKTARWPLLSQC
jgi:hemolysin-activating ACP:hemolysin acyltransferase